MVIVQQLFIGDAVGLRQAVPVPIRQAFHQYLHFHQLPRLLKHGRLVQPVLARLGGHDHQVQVSVERLPARGRIPMDLRDFFRRPAVLEESVEIRFTDFSAAERGQDGVRFGRGRFCRRRGARASRTGGGQQNHRDGEWQQAKHNGLSTGGIMHRNRGRSKLPTCGAMKAPPVPSLRRLAV